MSARTFTGTLPTGVPVAVTVHDAEGVADLAFKHDDRWSAPVELSEEVEQPRESRPGDRCQLLGDYKVRHVDCDEHADGTVTDVRTGEVVRP